MSEPEKPKRRFWQIHLSTAVILMIIASLMAYPIIFSPSEFPEEPDNGSRLRFVVAQIVISIVILQYIAEFLEYSPPPQGEHEPARKPKRPWFRFHLLTAVLMMVTAGVIAGLNIAGYQGEFVINLETRLQSLHRRQRLIIFTAGHFRSESAFPKQTLIPEASQLARARHTRSGRFFD